MRTDIAGVLALALVTVSPASAQSAIEMADRALQAGDVAQALTLLNDSARAGDAEAHYQLGILHRDGLVVSRDDERALAHMRAAADAGLADAQNALGALLLETGGAAVSEQAIAWLIAAADQGSAEHQYHAAVAIETFRSDQLAQAINWYQRAAEQEYAPAISSLGVLALEGSGQARNPGLAAELFERAALLGDARGANNLGIMLSRGQDLERDYARAAEYFSRAAEQGLPEALRNLSVLYENAYGVELDEALAAELLAQARQIETPSVAAVLQSVGFPFDARLVEPDWAQALSAQDERAARAGDPVALYGTAFRYLFGYGVRTNESEAVARFEASASAGFGGAALSLGLLYANGSGVPQSYREAYVWFSRAHQLGVGEAAALRDLVATRMTASSLAAAQARVSQ